MKLISIQLTYTPEAKTRPRFLTATEDEAETLIMAHRNQTIACITTADKKTYSIDGRMILEVSTRPFDSRRRRA